jgi:hypothetical protein
LEIQEDGPRDPGHDDTVAARHAGSRARA